MNKSSRRMLPMLWICAMLSACVPGLGAPIANTPSGFPTLVPLPTETPFATTQRVYATALPPGAAQLPTAAIVTERQPISLIGSGDSVVDVAKWAGPALLHARYGGDSNFAVSNFDANNHRIDLLINTTGVYDGFRPLDLLEEESTTRFEVKAAGPWHLEVLPLTKAPTFDVPAKVAQRGDIVFWLKGSPDLLTSASNSHSNFVVYGFSRSGGRDLLINKVGPYSGTVILPTDTYIIAVQAEGAWTMEITAK